TVISRRGVNLERAARLGIPTLDPDGDLEKWYAFGPRGGRIDGLRSKNRVRVRGPESVQGHVGLSEQDGLDGAFPMSLRVLGGGCVSLGLPLQLLEGAPAPSSSFSQSSVR